MQHPIVFFDIAGPDDQALELFCATALGWDSDARRQFSASIRSPMQGAIGKDPAEKRLDIGVEDIVRTLALVEQNSSTSDTTRFDVSSVAVLDLVRDVADNPMGLVEMNGVAP